MNAGHEIDELHSRLIFMKFRPSVRPARCDVDYDCLAGTTTVSDLWRASRLRPHNLLFSQCALLTQCDYKGAFTLTRVRVQVPVYGFQESRVSMYSNGGRSRS